jgi:MoaA/NifB/PqqE/SkfB family radical SAM enzyme
LEFFKRNFTPEFILSNVEKITFCGDDGDPIYAHDLIAVIEYIKSVKSVEIVVITNGSHKRETWWSELGSVLDDTDTVHFSIDGWDNESNNQYRVNSDFDSIIRGIVGIRRTSACRLVWAAIAFKFNELHLDRMQSMAQQLNMDVFQITRSTKFGSVYPGYGVNDALEPSAKYVSSTQRFEREVVALTQKTAYTEHKINVALYNKVKDNTDIVPLCEIGNKGLYIDAQGRLFPCCWVANRYSHNTEWQQLADQFDLKQRTLTEVVADPFWETEFRQFGWQECRTKCAKAVVNQDYATNW